MKQAILAVCILSLFSCQKELSYEEYSAYISDPQNGLRKNYSSGDFELSTMFEPVEYLIGKEAVHENEEAYRSSLEKNEHFQFRIKLMSGGNILKYAENVSQNEMTRINYFSFEVSKDFLLISEKDTLPCKLCHYSRNYNLSPTIDLSLSFDAMGEVKSDLQLVYTDTQFDLGIVKFLFRKEDLQNLPKLR